METQEEPVSLTQYMLLQHSADDLQADALKLLDDLKYHKTSKKIQNSLSVSLKKMQLLRSKLYCFCVT